MDLVNQSVLMITLYTPPLPPMALQLNGSDSAPSLEGRLLFAVPKSE